MTQVESSSDVIGNKIQISPDEINENITEELSEDMEVMGPGQILSDARNKMGLSQQEVADKLNFRKTLVENIESELFDPALPETFNRGYLRNYAKLVNVSQEDVLVSYEQLNVAKAQASELQSFSKGTEKLAENNRIMWISYLILALLIGSSVVWWMQNHSEQTDTLQTTETVTNEEVDNNASAQSSNLLIEPSVDALAPEDINNSVVAEEQIITPPSIDQEIAKDNTAVNQIMPDAQTEDANLAESADSQIAQTNEPETILTNVTFTFSGDCWVNISDATGERIAWGVKKLGYVMKISGQAPFNVTLGKPELVAINFADENIDMTQFNAGNIAKFTLPVAN